MVGVDDCPGDNGEILDCFSLVPPWERMVVAVVGFSLHPGSGPNPPPSKYVKGDTQHLHFPGPLPVSASSIPGIGLF